MERVELSATERFFVTISSAFIIPIACTYISNRVVNMIEVSQSLLFVVLLAVVV